MCQHAQSALGRRAIASLSLLCGLGLAVSVAVSGRAEPVNTAPTRKIDFATDVRPILAAKCYACHGERSQQSGLRLDSRALSLHGGDTGKSIVPGKSAESEVYLRVTSTDPKKVMPPGGKGLSKAEADILRAWIDQGAEWPDQFAGDARIRSNHWAFQPITRPKPPQVKHRAWVKNPIDQFILARLEAAGLSGSAEADRVTLIRRVSLDLLGLPPTPQEVDAFLADTRPGAYERLVDRLLASPHYGERWGRHWLDAARYADSNGFTIDSPRTIWPYRDWVINSLNSDMPFDQFAVEQLAGDLLPNPTQSQLIATGFHRNTLINEEGGTDPEQFRIEAVVDRVNTTGQVFLGLTLGCAQCHTHKYDPITQKEYYQFFAFFNNSDEPKLPLPTPEQERRLREVKTRLAAVQQQLKEEDRQTARRQAEWEQAILSGRGPSIAWSPLPKAEAVSEGGATFQRLDDGSLLVSGQIPDDDTYVVTAPIPAGGITALRLEALTYPSIPGSGPGLTPHGNFVLSEFEVSVRRGAEGEQKVEVARAEADFSQQNMPVAHAIDGNRETGWGIYTGAGQGSIHTDRTALFVLKQPVQGSGQLVIRMRQLYKGPRYQIGRFRLTATHAAAGQVALGSGVGSSTLLRLLEIPAAQRTPEQQAKIAAEFKKQDPRRIELTSSLTKLQQEEKSLQQQIPATLILRERSELRPSFIHIRGDFLRKGQPVSPGTPAVLHTLDRPASTGSDSRPNRLDLARWLVDPENPLTARVMVNRMWQQYFGVGLVETENDFGTQGTPPTHPELLDYLASEFMARGWSMKAMHRLIVTSATYRQSSHARRDLASVDPNNKLLGRQNRLRLDAEIIRDASLVASGLLSRKIGGPSVYPPAPEGLGKLTQVNRPWRVSEGPDRYRRGMYTFHQRSNPYAMFATFDAPDGNVSCTRRLRSNTPTQALVLANDASLFEMAQELARQTLAAELPSDPARLRFAFRRCLSREPSPVELTRLLAFYHSQLQSFTDDADAAAQVAPARLPEGVDRFRGAAWTAVARALMNVDEFITRE